MKTVEKTTRTVLAGVAGPVLAALVAVAAVPGGAAHAQATAGDDGEASWVHVRVDEADGSEVNLNLPIGLVDVALKARGDEIFGGEDLRIGPDGDYSVRELRAIWKELRGAGDAEFVRVRDGDERVRIFREGDRVHVHVDEGESERVRIEMPARVVDALLSAQGEELDVAAAARELGRGGEGEVVSIDDDGTRVRIWVDDSSTQGE